MGLTIARHHHHHTQIGKVYINNLLHVHSSAYDLDDNAAYAKGEDSDAAKKAADQKKYVEASNKRVKEAAKEDYSFSSIVVSLVNSTPFQMRSTL